MTEPLYVSFLWHMHQPFYKDPVRGEYVLPWVYLHAVKDYYDMPAIVDAAPGARVVFNLVPSLLEQIIDYASGEAVDPFLLRARMSPAEMGEMDKLFILENFFSANRQRMIEPHRRYRELYALAGDGAPGSPSERIARLSDQDFLDLQVWFYLSWTGEAARRRFPLFLELIRKGEGFTAADKLLLLETQRELIGEIIPLYKRLHEEGKVELSVTPYFHPILPLLCDTRIARVAMPKANLPSIPYRYPEDARGQVAYGIETFEKLFGFTPKGMWPSEGSVSDEALAIMAEKGISWTASDEWVLSQTLPGGLGREREALYHPYSFRRGERDIALFFRDQGLSDLIGFTYSQWETERAVADFVGKLREVRQRCRTACVVPVILDGENAWEYYPENGLPFLSKLYAAIEQTPGLAAATFSEVLELVPERHPLGHVHPGSWINANYGIWIGHPEENLGWEYIAKARAAAVRGNPEVASLLSGGESRDETARLACKALYAAQGSDWFWWYGDDHYSPHSGSFDLLFRSHLMNVYQLLALEIPSELKAPIKKQFPAGFVRAPAAFITPAMTGVASDYFEWLAAGLYDLTKLSSAMHAAEGLLQSFFYGFDLNFFYFRIDGVHSLDKTLQQEDRLWLHLSHRGELRLEMELGSGERRLQSRTDLGWQETGIAARYSIGRIAEARVPLSPLGLCAGDQVEAYFTITRGGTQLGRWPFDATLTLSYAGPELGLELGLEPPPASMVPGSESHE
ncbi:MAG TPA: glycoside hydrolase [Geobacter sp.]|nr:glycoside hydrolase [Geobacter sp.]